MQITPITMVYDTQITIVFIGFINQQTSLGGPHCMLFMEEWYNIYYAIRYYYILLLLKTLCISVPMMLLE